MECNKRLDKNQKDFLKQSRSHDGFGAFSDPGVGKTIPALIKGLERGATRTLISCPVIALDVWRDAIKDDFDNSYKIYDTVDAIFSQRMKRGPAICLLNHDMVKNDKLWKKLRALDFDHFIVDEGDFLANHASAVSRRHCKLADVIPSRVVMTGTAWRNKDKDIFGLMKFINDGVLGSTIDGFKSRWCIMSGWMNKDFDVKPELIEELSDLTAPYFHRVSLDEIDKPPPKALPNDVVRVRLKGETKRIYRAMETELLAEYGKGKMTAKTELVAQLRCAEIANGVVTLDRPLKGSSDIEDILTPVTIKRSKPIKHRIGREKLSRMSRWIRQWKASDGAGQQMLVFYRFDMDGIGAEHVLERHYPGKWARIHGKTKRVDRRRLEKAFKAGKLDALILQITAGSKALNLQNAYTTLFLSFGYSHVDHSQARRRTRRRGQMNRCRYVYFIARNTIEDIMYEDLKRKKKRASYIYDRLRLFRNVG